MVVHNDGTHSITVVLSLFSIPRPEFVDEDRPQAARKTVFSTRIID
ncbi:unknown [Haloarcula marismortui ATCC 43049]|uniref:Uncharacterized protein n=1 Tax=Haloarcula marismortui (strain ATCC 43049 / DSM 3752 / JCM 8966 / VKM B-1809) TaxID=272569 RepID=Q5UY94_HALMA|nr:unknown [Haloarcula marismortui ATCC 43049]